MPAAAIDIGRGKAQIDHPVAVLRNVAADGIVEITDVVAVADQQLPAFVVDAADVHRHRAHRSQSAAHRRNARRIGGRKGVDHVFGDALVIVERKREAVPEEIEVQTDVRVVDRLPLDVLVNDLDVIVAADGRGAVERMHRHVLERRHVGELVQRLVVAQDSPAETRFERGDPLLVPGLEEGLLGDLPPHRHRREDAPAVLGAEFRRSVAAEVDRQQVAVVERIVQAAELREEAVFAQGARSGLVNVRRECERQRIVHREIGRRGAQIGEMGVLGLPTEHRLEIVASELAGIGERGREGVLLVVIERLGVAVLRGRTAEVVGLGVVVVAAAQLGRPREVQFQPLDDLPVNEKVGVGQQVGLLLMLERDDGHGIRTVEVDPRRNRRIVSVLVVDVHVGNRDPGERLRVGIPAQTNQIDARADGDGVVHLVIDVQTGRDALPVVIHLNPVLPFVSPRKVVAEFLAAARQRKVVALLDARLVDLVNPIGIRKRRRIGPDRIVLAQRLFYADIVGRAQQVVHVRILPDADMAGEREFGLGVETAFLGRDEHHAAGRTRTVDRRGAGVLDDLDGLDVVQVVVAVVVAGHAVDDEQRIQPVDRPDAADHDVRTAARLAAGLRDHHAGHLALQSLGHGTGRNVLEIIRFHGSDGARQIRFRLRSVPHDDHVVQPFGLFFEDDLQFIAVQHRECQALVADIGDEQGRTRGHRQREGAVRTGDRTTHGRSILDDNGGADQRIAVFVRHLAGNGAFGRPRVSHPHAPTRKDSTTRAGGRMSVCPQERSSIFS